MSLISNRLLVSLLTVSSIALSFMSHATQTLSKPAISAKFQELVPFKVVEINDHQTGMYEIVADRGIFYATKDGQHIFSGSVHQFQQGLPNLTEQKKASVAAGIIGHLSSTFVSYPAQNPRHEILVFFDSSCGYCYQLHRQIPDFNALGISVHYALYPRSGTHRNQVPTPEYARLSSVSCSSNKELAMDSLVSGQSLPPAQCDSQVQNHYQLGKWLGVAGTPAIFNMHGEKVADGYLPPQGLIARLEGK